MQEKLFNYLKLQKIFFIQDVSLNNVDIEKLKIRTLKSLTLKVKEAGAKKVKLNYYRSANPFNFFPNLKILLQEKYHMNKNQVEVTIKFPPLLFVFYGLMLVFYYLNFYLFSPFNYEGFFVVMPLITPFFFYLVLLINFLIYVRVADREIRAGLKDS